MPVEVTGQSVLLTVHCPAVYYRAIVASRNQFAAAPVKIEHRTLTF